MKLVPELLCSNIAKTKHFYTEILMFEIKYERPDEKFVYFTRDSVDIMVEELNGPGRRWLTGAMEPPFGRGVNLQWEVRDIDELYKRVKELKPESIFMEIEEKAYRCGEQMISQKQFIVQDFDGYLFRFCSDSL